MSTVVQQDHIATSHLARHFAFDMLNRWSIPVVTSHIPHGRFESHVPRDAQHRRAPSAKWRTKQIGMFPYCIGQSAITIFELSSEFEPTLENE